jgi:hypothetical protein
MSAHHSVESEYDVSKRVTIQGVVTKIEWTNPHARFWVDAKNDDGTVSNWEMELPPPNALKLRGVRMDFVKQGDPVTVDLWRAKNGSRLAHALEVTLRDGRVLNILSFWGCQQIQSSSVLALSA